jgi:hypothetical protein
MKKCYKNQRYFEKYGADHYIKMVSFLRKRASKLSIAQLNKWIDGRYYKPPKRRNMKIGIFTYTSTFNYFITYM